MINPNMTALGKSSSAIRALAAYGARRKQEIGAERVCDYSLGNPNVPCPQVITDCMRRLLEEETPAALHAYTASAGSLEARAAVAAYVNRTYGLAAEAGDVYLTAGAAASLTITLRAVSAAGEEVIVFTPYFPEYKVFIENGGAAVREVPVRADDFQIDFAALEAAFSEKTAALIVNSPNNPTGALDSAETLAALGDFLRGKEALYGKEIYLISDEPFVRSSTMDAGRRFRRTITKIRFFAIHTASHCHCRASESATFSFRRGQKTAKICSRQSAGQAGVSAMCARRAFCSA